MNVFQQEVTQWRNSLKISNSENVLISFAWAHDEEIKQTEMFPEFLCCDVTFGVNTERRDLFLIVVIDGHKKSIYII